MEALQCQAAQGDHEDAHDEMEKLAAANHSQHSITGTQLGLLHQSAGQYNSSINANSRHSSHISYHTHHLSTPHGTPTADCLAYPQLLATNSSHSQEHSSTSHAAPDALTTSLARQPQQQEQEVPGPLCTLMPLPAMPSQLGDSQSWQQVPEQQQGMPDGALASSHDLSVAAHYPRSFTSNGHDDSRVVSRDASTTASNNTYAECECGKNE